MDQGSFFRICRVGATDLWRIADRPGAVATQGLAATRRKMVEPKYEASMTELLRVEGLSKRFGGLAAVQDVGFSVKHGEILGLIGPNGAGKTTTFNMLVGLIKPTSGQVILEGKEIQHLPTHKIAAL